MITIAKIHIFKRHRGNLESWNHGSLQKERLIMDDEDWYSIESLLQDLHVVNNGLASDAFKENLYAKLSTECENSEAINLLKTLQYRNFA